MATIKAQKLLPPAKSSSSIIKTGKISVKKFQGKDQFQNSLVKYSESNSITLNEGLLKVSVKVLNIQKLINNNLLLKGKENKEQKKEKEDNQREEKEKKLKQKRNKFKLQTFNIPLPKLGLLDRINQFILFTFLGFVYNKTKQYLPQIIEFTKKFEPVGRFLEFLGKNLFNSFVDFIDFGYKAYDKVRSFAKNIGGDPFLKTFDDFSKNLNTFVNLAIIAGIASTGGTDFKKRKGKGGGFGKGKFEQESKLPRNERLRKYLNRGKETKSVERKFGNSAAVYYEQLRNEGRNSVQAFNEVKRKFQPRGLFGRGAISGLAGEGQTAGKVFRRGIVKAPRRLATKLLGKTAGKVVGKFPIIGPLIDFSFRYFVLKEPLGRSAAGAIGTAAGQALGAWLGGTVGGIAGSVVPIIGNILAGAAGVAIGEIIGGMIGDWIGTSLYDTITSYQENDSNTVGHAAGGKITTRKGQVVGGQVSRSLKRRIRRKVTPPKPQLTIPGNNVGGIKNIVKIFPDPEDDKLISPLKTIKNISEIFKQIPLIGGIMGISADMILGQKPDLVSYENFGQSLGNLIDQLVNKEIKMTYNDISNSILGMSNGGEIVDALNYRDAQIGQSIGTIVSQVIGKLIDDRIGKVFKLIDLELKKKPLKLEHEDQRGGQTSGPEGPADFSGSSGEEKAMHYLISQGLTGAQAAGIAGNLKQESHFDPNADNNVDGGHHGIAQWDKGVRWPRVSAYIRSIGMDPNTLEGQLSGLKWEAQGPESPSWKKVSTAGSAEQAAAIWLKEFERSGEKPGMEGYDNRIANANNLFSKYGSYQPTGGLQLGGKGIEKIINLGKQLLSQGYYVGYNKYFDGRNFVPQGTAYVGKHSSGSLHYSGRALDISGVPPQKLDQLYSQLKGTNPAQLLWRVPDHYDHLHVAYQKGGLIGKSPRKNLKSIQMQASYENSSDVIVMIQPVHIYKSNPMSSQNRTLSFGGGGGVNSNNTKHLLAR
jgi:hypothetical protein